MEIFRAYDIRGRVPEDLTEDIVYGIGRALVVYLECSEIYVGRDCRLSSPALHSALIKGIIDQGANVIDIGLCSTPMIYFASKYGPAAMITASHLPKEFNGLKFCRKCADPIGLESGLGDIKRIYEKQEFNVPKNKGVLKHENILQAYVSHCLSFANKIKPLTVVVDAGNGMGGLACSEIFKQLPCKIIPLYFEPDGTFPNHEANPIKSETLKDLQKTVKKHNADIGAAYDADCDRILFVDEKRNIVSGDLALGLLSMYFLKKNKGATVLYDLRSTHALPEFIKNIGGKAVQTRVGHAFIKPLMRQHQAILGGELSGHFYYKNNQYAESGDIALLLCLSLLSEENKSLSQLLKPLNKYSHSGEISFTVKNQKNVLNVLESSFEGYEINYLDGITLTFKDWWFNARPSQTEPVLRIVIEANTNKLMSEKLKKIKGIISKELM